MQIKLLTQLGKIAGLAGISLGVFLLLFENILKQKILPQAGLGAEQATHIILALVILIFGIAVVGMIVWLVSGRSDHPEEPVDPRALLILVAIVIAILFTTYKVAAMPSPSPSPPSADLTVRAHSADGKAPVIRTGKIVLDIANDRRDQQIGMNGEADFKGLPIRSKNQTIRLLPEVQGYESAWFDYKCGDIKDNVIDIPLKRLQSGMTLVGAIVPVPSNPANMRVLVDGQAGATNVNEFGQFSLDLKDAAAGDSIRIKVFSGHKLEYDDNQVLPGPVTLSLSSSPTSRPGNKNEKPP